MKVRVTPNAKAFSACLENGVLKIRVPAKAEGGKANQALVQWLSRLLGARVFISRGLKSRDKEIEVEGLSEREAGAKVIALLNANNV